MGASGASAGAFQSGLGNGRGTAFVLAHPVRDAAASPIIINSCTRSAPLSIRENYRHARTKSTVL
jgi:hypothetical protein